jgi:multicomponent K+:H+ antiporter subunit G
MTAITLPDWIALPAALLLISGGLFAFIGSCGLLRLRNFFARMHAPTMGATLGTGCILISSMLVSSALLDRPVIHALLITVFAVLSAPVSAITLMRAAISRTRRDTNGIRPD